MDTGRTAFILIYCLLFITNKSSATEEPNASAEPANKSSATEEPNASAKNGQTAATTSNPLGNSPGTSNTTNPSGGSAVEAKVGSTSAPLATSSPENKSASSTTQSPPGTSASSATHSPAGKSASASPAIQNPPGKSASASPTTQKTPEGSALPPAVGGRSASGSKATQTLPEESAGKSAATVEPKATQPAKLSPPAGIPKSGKSDDNITNETGKMHGSAGESSSTPKPDTPDNKKYFWILLPVGVAFLAVAMYFRYKFFKVHHHPETTDNGTENASFQRTESNRDGVTLLGVKSSGTEEGAAA
ncbi:uncharacterized protein LOC111194343 isoform X3 [Astyanax mexicanus]|uniref:uncharacterized protein LOC111194343 isoform X3 n=1 Tax=Astyanax mexicanus TaxID=7994 RepID=UPI0020CB6033|nr:uncharacterized protein LOC111194343 isoform X3 [Astyanax mexicanus]